MVSASIRYMGIAGGCFAIAGFLLSGTAAGSERRQLDAHEHGVTVLNVAAEGQFVWVELEGPAMNFIGFEHPPRTAEQTRQVADAVAELESADQLFQLSSAAGCTLTSAESRHVGDDDHDGGHDDHDDHADEHDGSHDDAGHDEPVAEAVHSEFAAHYEFSCTNPEQLTELQVTLFDTFPLTTEVEASFIGAEFQTFAELSPNSRVLSLQP